MMHRAEFMALACAQAMHATKNEAERREHVEAVKATAEAMADALGIRDDGSTDREEIVRARGAEFSTREELKEARKEIERERAAHKVTADGLALRCASFEKRIAELEAQIEQYTAPKPAAPRGGR